MPGCLVHGNPSFHISSCPFCPGDTRASGLLLLRCFPPPNPCGILVGAACAGATPADLAARQKHTAVAHYLGEIASGKTAPPQPEEFTKALTERLGSGDDGIKVELLQCRAVCTFVETCIVTLVVLFSNTSGLLRALAAFNAWHHFKTRLSWLRKTAERQQQEPSKEPQRCGEQRMGGRRVTGHRVEAHGEALPGVLHHHTGEYAGWVAKNVAG